MSIFHTQSFLLAAGAVLTGVRLKYTNLNYVASLLVIIVCRLVTATSCQAQYHGQHHNER